MARNVKTDLFAGMIKEPVKKSELPEEESKVVDNVQNKTESSKETRSSKRKKDKVEVLEKTKIKQETSPTNTNNGKAEKSIDDFLHKEEKPKSASHTFYLRNSVFKKLDGAARKRKISTSKLLEAIIEMTLE